MAGVRRGQLVGAGIFLAAFVAAVEVAHPLRNVPTAPFAALTGAPGVAPARDAFGISEGVRLRLALPGDSVEFPLEVSGDPGELTYRWISMQLDAHSPEGVRPLRGARVAVPEAPGFYRLALRRGEGERVVSEVTVAVLVPFSSKRGGLLNGYRIGTYLGERLGQVTDRPQGFLEVHPEHLDLVVSRHLRLRDFITKDAQDDVWPKYVALDPRLLDKLELVMGKLRHWTGSDTSSSLALDVHSGFRTPAHNARVPSAASDSRHQHGDAADVVIDADGDGRITRRDEGLVTRAVDEVEREHPELAGGLGLYNGRQYRTPYVHIDARGRRTRWRG